MMKNKICVITGANSGIGKATAEGLAQQGAHIVMICRNRDKGEQARQEIRQTTGNQQIDLLLADLGDLTAVRQVAAEIQQRYSQLDRLINNAGAMFTKRQETAAGYEKTLAVNHLGHFVLTNALLPMLKETAEARIIHLSSDMHFGNQINFEDIHLTQKYSAAKAYGQTKLANILFSNELARRLAAEGSDVTTNALHPGFVGSNFGKENGGLMAIMLTLLRPFTRSNQKGAETSLYLATSDKVTGITGRYFANCTPKPPSEIAQDPAIAQKLWQVSDELVG